MVLNNEKIVFAKRIAMDTVFWTACPLDDDDGYDRLMKMTSPNDLQVADWGGIYLHTHLNLGDFDKIKRLVRDTAIKLLCNLVGVTPDVAITSLERTKSTNVNNDSGEFTKCGYEGITFA